MRDSSSDVQKALARLPQRPTVAVIGYSDKPARPAHYVPKFLHERGAAVIAVNPQLAGQIQLGREAVSTLAELPTAPDLVLVFRRSEAVSEHAEDLARLPNLPVLWMQQGISNAEVRAAAEARGTAVVENRCLMVEWPR